MNFSSRDGLLFGVFMAAFGIYSIVNKGLHLDSEGWGDIATVLVGVVIIVISLLYPVIKGKKGE